MKRNKIDRKIKKEIKSTDPVDTIKELSVESDQSN
jgi:hypothetical protein